MLNPKIIKKDFQIFRRKIKGKTLIYLDNASTTQKPKSVIAALKKYYENYNANIHRGIHTLSEEATEAYENSRRLTAKFINAKSEKEIIFTRNTTESINLVAKTWAEKNIKKDSEIIISGLEHHSNLIPWQEIAKKKKAKLKIIPVKKDFTLDMKTYKTMLSPKTKLVSITGMSNVTGTIPNIKEIIRLAKKFGAVTLIDGAQIAAHTKTNVQNLNCDFFAFSSHKMLGPTGVGILYGKENILRNMPPFLFGGDMVKTVTQFDAVWNNIPWKFEAGTPNIADVIAFSEAIKYLEKTGMRNIEAHEKKLLKYAIKKLSKYKEVTLFTPKNAGGILSFKIKGIHPHDIAAIFNEEGIAIRSGHHCSQPLMETLHVPATARISFYLYNTFEDIDRVEKALKKAIKIFA